MKCIAKQHASSEVLAALGRPQVLTSHQPATAERTATTSVPPAPALLTLFTFFVLTQLLTGDMWLRNTSSTESPTLMQAKTRWRGGGRDGGLRNKQVFFWLCQHVLRCCEKTKKLWKIVPAPFSLFLQECFSQALWDPGEKNNIKLTLKVKCGGFVCGRPLCASTVPSLIKTGSWASCPPGCRPYPPPPCASQTIPRVARPFNTVNPLGAVSLCRTWLEQIKSLGFCVGSLYVWPSVIKTMYLHVTVAWQRRH